MVLLERNNETKVFDTKVDGEFVGMKLLEHSWWKNSFVNTICKMIFENPAHIIWMGDYANDVIDENNSQLKEKYKKVWGEKVKSQGVKKDILLLDGLYLVNHTKKEYINCDEYKKRCLTKDGWCIHPLPLMTALGNGQGGGDYFGQNEEIVGYWAGDEISIEKEPPEFAAIDEDVTFIEE